MAPATVLPLLPQAAWTVRLLGAVELRHADGRIVRLPTRAAALLLARLALAPQRMHPREELVELLWPGVALEVGRNRLRQVLSILNRLLQDNGIPPILADRQALRLGPGAPVCDVGRFESALRASQWHEARTLNGGELMPGHFDEWVHDERLRVATLQERLAALEPPFDSQAKAASSPAALEPSTPLPQYLTRSFGTEPALQRLHAALRTQRLVTLHGPGGQGKTRLAVELTAAWLAEGGHVYFASLVGCHKLEAWWTAIAQALHLPGRDEGDEAGRVAAALGRTPALLVLDNMEQLVDQAGTAIARLLAGVPTLRVLLTSRRVLGVEGEAIVVMPSLALPVPEPTLAEAAASPAVALFTDRARLADADFKLDEHNLAAVVHLVRVLHGMPLALELAASRVRSQAPAQMVTWLSSDDGDAGAHLALLTRATARHAHDLRHASMDQVVAWSWCLLPEQARSLLKAAACLDGDATASALAAQLGLPEITVAARLDDLVGHALLHPVTTGNAAALRLALQEPVREFVLAQCSAEQRRALRLAGRQHLLRWAQSLSAASAPNAVRRELVAIQAALAHAAEHPELSLRLMLALRPQWDADGLPLRLQNALAAAIEAVQSDAPALVSAAHELLANRRFESGFIDQATAHAQAALEWAGADPGLRAMALVRFAWVELASGRSLADAARPLAELQDMLNEALALARAAGHREAEARALHQLAALMLQQPDHGEAAEALLAQSQALWQSLGDRRKAMARLRNRAQHWCAQGRLQEAQAGLELSARAAEEDGDWLGQIDTLLSMSKLLSRQRQWAEALRADQQCVALCWQRWHRHGLAFALWQPPLALVRLRRTDVAVKLQAFAEHFWHQHFSPQAPVDAQVPRRVLRMARALAGAQQVAAWQLEGQAMALADAVALLQAQQG